MVWRGSACGTAAGPGWLGAAGPKADPAITKQLGETLVGLDPKRDLGVDRIGDTERITGFSTIDDKRYDDLRKARQAEKGKKPK